MRIFGERVGILDPESGRQSLLFGRVQPDILFPQTSVLDSMSCFIGSQRAKSIKNREFEKKTEYESNN